MDENIDLSDGENNDNVLRYIYMLKEHINNLSLIWRGIAKDSKGNFVRVSEPCADDSFIFEQMNVLSSVLNPHSFVSNVKTEERNNIILDTLASFLSSMNRNPTINRNKKFMMRESFFNTLLLFLNILRDGAGAQFTLGAQTGVTMDVYKNQREQAIKPIIDVPRAFGFGKNRINNNNNFNKVNNNESDEE